MTTSNRGEGGVALVTGASRGIGKVIALRLARAGYDVAVNYRAAVAEAEAVVRDVEACGRRAVALRADLAIEDDAALLFQRAQDTLGLVNVLINNAGITRDKLVIQMGPDDWDATWQTDLVGPRTVLVHAARAMAEGDGGRIVNISSVVGSAGNAGQSNYAAAKSAILGLTREAAARFASDRVTVNCVVPGYVATDATAHLTEEQNEGWMRRIPAGRYGTSDEVADLVLYLVSPLAGYITGQCIAVDGGFLAATGFGLGS